MALFASDPVAAGFSASALNELEQSVRNDDFKQVTSVLIARHGKLALERCFDSAGVEALRNTRSATKTITGMLVDIAID